MIMNGEESGGRIQVKGRRLCRTDGVRTSLGTLFVRQGGLNSEVMLRPTMAPTTVRGKWTKRNMATINCRERERREIKVQHRGRQ